MELELFENNSDAISVVASWYRAEWGYLAPDRTIENITCSLKKFLYHNQLPLMVIAKNGSEICGVAQLKFHEMDIYPEKEHWLGGVYVKENYRGKGLATSIIRKVLDQTSMFGVEKLYLQTIRHDGGLYSKLGWDKEAIVNYRSEDVLVMVRSVCV